MSDYKTLYDLLSKAKDIIEPFAKRAAFLDDEISDEITWWHPAIGSPVEAGDLRRAKILFESIKTFLDDV